METSSNEISSLISNPASEGKKFNITLEELVSLIQASMNGSVSTALNKIEHMGGETFLEKALNTNFQKGLNSNQNELHERELLFGHNRKIAEKPQFWAMLCTPFSDVTSIILLICVVLTILIQFFLPKENNKNDLNDSFALLFCIMALFIIQIVLSIMKEIDQAKQKATLLAMKTVEVIRDNERISIREEGILTGDILLLYPGLTLPCDGLLIEGGNVVLNESNLTGEINDIKKKTLKECINEQNNLTGSNPTSSPFLISGTVVVDGEGLVLCLAVGQNSVIGKIQSVLVEETNETPLQEKIASFATVVGKYSVLAAILIFFVILIHFIVQRLLKHDFNKEEHLAEFFGIFIYTICFVITTVPENLSLCLILLIAQTVKNLLYSNNLVRKIEVCEKLGEIDVICTEKTGVLTTGQPQPIEFWNDKSISFYPNSQFENFSQSPGIKKFFLECSVLNSSADLELKEGSATDRSLIEFLQYKCSVNCKKIKDEAKLVQTFQFTSKRKRRSCIISLPESNKLRILVKGASEILLDECSFIHNLNDEVSELTQDQREKIVNQLENLAKEAMRTILFAYKDFDSSENIEEITNNDIYKIEKSNLTFIGILGFRDCLRMQTPIAIQSLQKAGIKITMHTGDNKHTSRVIAKECGIISNETENQVFEGPEFFEKLGGVKCDQCGFNCMKPNHKLKISNASEFQKISKNLSILARARPEDMFNLVLGYQQLGHSVAVISSGTNSAPAISRADAGFGMGISGTEISREASSIILLDDNFHSLVPAIMWGRHLHEMIKIFAYYQATTIFSLITISVISAFILQKPLFQPIHYLWISLVIDGIAIFFFAFEKPEGSLLEKKPIIKTDQLIPKETSKYILHQVIYQCLVIFTLIFFGHYFIPEYEDDFDSELLKNNDPLRYKYHFYGKERFVRGLWDSENKLIENIYGPSRIYTIVFNAFIMMQLFNLLTARIILKKKNISRESLLTFLLAGITHGQLITFGSQYFHVYRWQNEFGFSGLNCVHWMICLGFGLGSLIIRKYC